jgi:hypothetical protein
MQLKSIMKVLLIVLSLIPFAVVTSKALAARRTAEETGLEEDRERAGSCTLYAVGTLVGTMLLLLLGRWFWSSGTTNYLSARMNQNTDFYPDDEMIPAMSMSEAVPAEESMNYFEPDE